MRVIDAPCGALVVVRAGALRCGLVAGLGLVAAIAPASPPVQASQPLIASVLWMGDSIAYDLAPAVVESLGAAGLQVTTFTFAGVSMSGDAFLPAGERWLEDRIRVELEKSHASIVIWQLSAWDLPGWVDLNRLTHTRFVDLALPGRAAVVFVTAPPLKPEAYTWTEDWSGLDLVAGELADSHPGRVLVADASSAWGDSFVEFADDGSALRKPDGVHVCPVGATIFADFLVHWLDDRFAGVSPVDPAEWSQDWWSDGRYDSPPQACTRRELPDRLESAASR